MPLTLLDLAKRTGSEQTVGLIEDAIEVAPEMRTLPVKTVKGTTFKSTLLTKRGSGSFRRAGEGVATVSNEYEQKLAQCYFFDAQMEIDEALVRGDDGSVGDILSQEASGIVSGSMVTLGQQIYTGQGTSLGFPGFDTQIDASMIVDALGTGQTTWTAYAVWEHEQGVHLRMGEDGRMEMKPWQVQKVTKENKSFHAHCSNLSFWIGLAFGSKYSVGVVKNITSAKPLTDALGNELFAKFPIGRKPSRWFISRDPLFWLQRSRSSVGNQKSDARGDAFAPIPESLAGVPITPTDAILARAAY